MVSWFREQSHFLAGTSFGGGGGGGESAWADDGVVSGLTLQRETRMYIRGKRGSESLPKSK